MRTKAEVTAFLSLTFILIVTFIGSVMEVTSIQISKNYRRADAERAIECIFAEYQKELLEEYDVFALDASYESGKYSDTLIQKRLEYYGLVNSNNIIERIKFLSDGKAEGFCEQISYYMEHKYGIDLIEKNVGKTDDWEQQKEIAKDFEKQESQNEEMLNELFREGESELPEEGNPIFHVSGLKKLSLLKLVMPEGKVVSETVLPMEELPTGRTLNRGYGEFEKKTKSNETVDRLLFGEYILEHFQTAVDESANVVHYEVEYLLAGKHNDRENLKAVVNKLMSIRFVPNYVYLQGSAEKKAQAQALALTLSTAAALPQATEALTQGILLAWAFGESIVDVRVLMQGNRVSLMKDDSNWQLSLSGLLKLGESGDIYDGSDQERGWDYEDYLRMLLFLEQKEDLAMRGLDLIELNLKKIHGLEFFKVDHCVTKLEIESKCSFRRGITYTFPVCFEYQ